MNNRISQAFTHGKTFVGFVTGGDPDLVTTGELVRSMEQAGADMVEIGIPFSDPIAEGTVIQAASERALSAGCTVDRLFALVKELRKTVQVPLLFVTYANPILAYGTDRFMAACADAGLDGVIVPDVPYEERSELEDACRRHGVARISMIAPTSNERAARIAKESQGFLYCVSSLEVTDMRHQNEIGEKIVQTVRLAKQAADIPCVVDCGISTPEQAETMAGFCDGVIVGSAIVRLVEQYGKDSPLFVADYVKSMKRALSDKGL